MSEKDNLPKADGTKEAKPTENGNITVEAETAIENISENSTETLEETASNIEEEKEETASVEKEEVEKVIPENFEETTSEIQTETEGKTPETGTSEKDQSENITENKKDAEATNDDALNEIEVVNAKETEGEEEEKHPKAETKDYQAMSMEDLVDEFERLVENEKIQTLKSQIETIKSVFSTKFSALLEGVKAKFIAEGGNTIDFYFDSPLKKRYNSIFKTYREKRQAHYKDLEKSLKENLEIRLEIIEKIKDLINIEENINTTYKHFKALQESWRSAGSIPQDKYNTVWNNYHHHIEIFYDFLHLNRELRDLDFKHNLEQKLKLIDRAEELAQDDDNNRSFRELQVLHKIWKEELGPVDREHREPIWERFSAATKRIHEKRHAHFKELDKAYEKNLEVKHDIIAQIKVVTKDETNNHSIWQKRIRTIEDLRNHFFKAGKVPIKVNETTWSKFKIVVREFNHKKNIFYKGLKKDQYENLQKKLALIKIAEENKDNEDFDTTTPLMKKIQNEWKNIGHVPRKDSDKVWKQFKAACNHYFNKFHDVKNESNKEEIEALDKKNALLETLKSIKITDGVKSNLALIKEYIATWKTIGRVPYNKRFIDGKFNKTVDSLYNKMDISKAETELLKYDNKLETLAGREDKRLLDNELNYIRKRVDEIKGEINQLENNLQFFSNVDDTNPLVKDVHKSIENSKTVLTTWESKLRKIKKFY